MERCLRNGDTKLKHHRNDRRVPISPAGLQTHTHPVCQQDLQNYQTDFSNVGKVNVLFVQTIQCRRQKGGTLHTHTCNRLTLEIGVSISTQRCASVCCCLFSHSVAPSNDIPLLSSALVSASASLHASLYQPHRCAERDTKESITSVYDSSTKSTRLHLLMLIPV